MSFTKKVNDDIVKDVKNSINDISKTLEMACDPSRQITLEIIEYYKKRIEIENDYGLRMLRLREKVSEKVQKMTPLVQYKDNLPDTRYELYHLLKVIESEVKDKAAATIKYSEKISNHIIPAMNKYIEFNAQKLNKNKKLLSTLSEGLIQGINTTFNKYQLYSKNVLTEQKSTAEYDSYVKRKNSKDIKNPEKTNKKLMKLEKTSKEDIINTDRCRNQYILAHHSSKKCQDRFFKHQTSQIVLTTNLKFGEFWTYFLTAYTTALQELNEVSNANLKNYDKLSFSDAVESEIFLDRYKNKFLEKSIKFPLKISKKDRTNAAISDGPLKAELENDLCIIQDNIKKVQDELSASLKLNSNKKALKIQWENDNLPSDAIKESKTFSIGRKPTLTDGFDYSQYIQTLESSMILELSFYNEGIKVSWIKTALDKTRDISKNSTMEVGDDKKRMEFGVDIVQHCNTFNVKIPAVITLCSKYLYSNNLLKTVGIFRVSPSTLDVKEIMESITENGFIKEGSGAAAVATIMKQYLRNMKNFIDIKDLPKILGGIAYATKNKYIEETRKIMDQLSIQSRDLLIFIAKFLRHIAKMSDVNKMDLQNLSIVFGTTLFSSENLGENTFDNQTDVNAFLKVFCERIFEIFPDESTLLEFEEIKNDLSGENINLDILDDGDSFDDNITVIGEIQNKESALNTEPINDMANSFCNVSITDLPPPDEQLSPNEILSNNELTSAIETNKSNNMSENEE